MLRLQFKDAKRVVANCLSLCATDNDRISSYTNRGCQRLLYGAKFQGTYQRFRFCITNSGCITLPRELETVESFAIDHTPGTVRGGWFEFLEHGAGLAPSHSSRSMIDQGEVCSFDNVIGSGKKLAIYCDKQEAAGKTITLQFLGSNGEFVTSMVGGNVIDGERIALPPAGTYAYTTNAVLPGGLATVYRDETLGRTRLYEYDPATGMIRPLAVYQRDETNPVYRKYLIPGVSVNSTQSKSVTVVGKLRFIPVFDDDDFLCISHIEAVRLAAQAVLCEENKKMEEAAGIWAVAYGCLNAQLAHFKGDGEVQPIAMVGNFMPAIQNII